MLGLGAPTLALTGMTGCSKAHRRKSNIIFFLVDDLGWRDCACFGSPFYETPHIDRLELYNLREDIGEKHNRVDQYPEVVSRLHRMLQNWRREVDAKMPIINAKE